MPQNLSDLLQLGLASLDLNISAQQVNQLLNYVLLLDKWNHAYNLSAVRDIEKMISRHLLDSLVLLPKLTTNNILDVGTGAGLPGIPLAIAAPQKQFTLLDSNGKKTRFLFQVKTQLRLDNVTVVGERVETYRPVVDKKFEAITSRAFASLGLMLEQTQHLLAENGFYYALKGQYPETELREVKKPFKVQAVESLEVPGCDGDRHLVIISRGHPH